MVARQRVRQTDTDKQTDRETDLEVSQFGECVDNDAKDDVESDGCDEYEE